MAHNGRTCYWNVIKSERNPSFFSEKDTKSYADSLYILHFSDPSKWVCKYDFHIKICLIAKTLKKKEKN